MPGGKKVPLLQRRTSFWLWPSDQELVHQIQQKLNIHNTSEVLRMGLKKLAETVGVSEADSATTKAAS
jgi:hypothetical protein